MGMSLQNKSSSQKNREAGQGMADSMDRRGITAIRITDSKINAEAGRKGGTENIRPSFLPAPCRYAL